MAWPASGVPADPYAVYVVSRYRFKTLPLEFDGPGAQNDADRAADALRRAGVQFATTRSGPNGGCHLLPTLNKPVPAYLVRRVGRGLKTRFPTLDTTPLNNPKTAAIRPPLAAHRLGGRSEVAGDVVEALNALEVGNGPEAWARLLTLVGIRLLTSRMEVLLVHGDLERRYQSRSEVVQALSMGFINGGYAEDEFLAALERPPPRRGRQGPSVDGAATSRLRRGCSNGWPSGTVHRSVGGAAAAERTTSLSRDSGRVRGGHELAPSTVHSWPSTRFGRADRQPRRRDTKRPALTP